MSLRSLQARTFTRETVTAAIRYLLAGEIPAHETNPARFRRRWEHFRLDDDHVLFYGAKQVIPEEDITDTMEREFKHLGDMGRDRFYAYLKAKYVGISHARVADFLQHAETHQLHLRPHKEHVIKPLVTTGPRKIWQCDLIDFTSYFPTNGFRYLLTVIDVFSKFAYVKPLANKTAQLVAARLRDIFAEEQPSTLQTDNGGEFQGAVTDLCQELNIRQVFSKPYTPQSQGAVERFNGTIKKMIFGWITQHGTRTFGPHLQALVTAYNQTEHTTTKRIPEVLHHAEGRPIRQAAARLRKRADQMTSTTEFTPIAEGDQVRLALRAIDPAVRRLGTFRRGALPQWSREIYRVARVIFANQRYGHNYYIVEGMPTQFRREDVQKVLPPTLHAGAPQDLPGPAGDDDDEQPPEPRQHPGRERRPPRPFWRAGDQLQELQERRARG